jgi:hypothetical protein
MIQKLTTTWISQVQVLATHRISLQISASDLTFMAGSFSFGQQSSGGATSSSGSMANSPYFEGAIFDAEKGTEHAVQSGSSPKVGRMEMKPIGIVKCASSNREGSSLDWAVLELDPTSSPQTGLPLKHCVFPDTFKVSEFASPISSSREVWTMTVTGRIRGYLSATPSFVRLPGHPSAIETNLLHLDGPLRTKILPAVVVGISTNKF